MKIGIITFLKADSYGAELQAFALPSKLRAAGYDCELIDYPHYKHPSYIPCPIAAPLFDTGLANRVKTSLYPFWRRIRTLPAWRAMARRKERADDFHRLHTPLSKTCFRSMEQLYKADHGYDVYMTGSDQVWNPRLNCSLDPYFLTFAPPDKPRVSYAASFGVKILPPNARDIYADRLSKYSFLSVREKPGVDIIRDLLGRVADQVLDPTLLLDAAEWSRVARGPALSRDYILIFELGNCPQMVMLAERAASMFKNVEIVRLPGNYRRPVEHVRDLYDAGPSEFVGLFKHASYVITNSFHGTAFAVNFRIPFVSLLYQTMIYANRISSFLDLTGLADRIVDAGDMHGGIPSRDMDFESAHCKLTAAKRDSLDFLARACPLRSVTL
jgi:hypothetical protein